MCDKCENEKPKNIEQFQTLLYNQLDKRADAIIELINAICSNPSARSVVELSLDSGFHRTHDSIYKAIEQFSIDELAKVTTQFVPKIEPSKWTQLSVDVTSAQREHAHTLEDRAFVYKPTTIKGNKPIIIGHQYSTIVYHPKSEENQSSNWVMPLSVQRVSTNEKKPNTAVKQIKEIMESERFLESDELVVVTGDSDYSQIEYLYDNQEHENLVSISRVASNRTFYQPYTQKPEDGKKKGRKRRYGDRFKLSDPTTWSEASSETRFDLETKNGKRYEVQLQQWDKIIMKGKNKPKKMRMYDHPFSLIRIHWIDPETGEPKYPRDMWLIVMGKRRMDISLKESYDCYANRSDIEHFFRFGKQKLLLDSYQTPKVQNEENWWKIVHLAYLQLWLARELAKPIPRPWEDHLETSRNQINTPGTVQRDFTRINSLFETPCKLPKRRGNSLGCPQDHKRERRIRHPVIKKGQKSMIHLDFLC